MWLAGKRMSTSDLARLIKKYKSENDNTPIVLTKFEDYLYAINNSINSNGGEILLLIGVEDKSNIVLNCLNQPQTILNLVDFLSESSNKIRILTNNYKAIVQSDFYMKLGSVPKVRAKVNVTTIPKAVYDALKKDDKTNDLLIAQSDTVIFFHKEEFNCNGQVEASCTSESFISINDKDFHKVIKHFYLITLDRSMNNQIQAGE